MKPPMNPPLKWVGGKRWHVPAIKKMFEEVPNNGRLVELFCGSCAITLGVRPPRALLNDANPHLMNFWGAVQRGVPFDTGVYFPKLYKQYRAEFNLMVHEGLYAT